jgi:putative membrane protein
MSTPEQVRADPFDVQPSVSNHFAWLNTAMGLQRTLMSAVRTAVSLIGFGFTVAQFFEKMRSNLPAGLREVRADVPRNLGLVLIGAGVVSLAVFTWQYHAAMHYMRSPPYGVLAGRERPMHSSAYIVAFTVLLIGVAAFGSVLLRF